MTNDELGRLAAEGCSKDMTVKEILRLGTLDGPHISRIFVQSAIFNERKIAELDDQTQENIASAIGFAMLALAASGYRIIIQEPSEK